MHRSTSRVWLLRLAPVFVFVLVLLGQAPLILNPGYFSHDELQWAAFADQGVTFSWTAIDAFQYRPLTFNLWLWLSRHWFAQPHELHGALVAWGAANAALLCVLTRRLGVAAGPAMLGALVFGLGPYAAYVHGWVGTIADLAWVSCALLTVLWVRESRSVTIAAVGAALLGLVGLLAKEAALVIPALLAIAWWLDGRKRTWAAAALATAVVAAVYLALRLGALLHAPSAGAQYVVSLANVPLRWVEYQLFPPMPSRFEISGSVATAGSKRIVGTALLWGLLLATLWRSHRRLAALFVFGGAAALGPVLLMASSANQYGYGFAAVTAAVAAAAWTNAPRWGRMTLALAALLCVWHGVNVTHVMRRAGDVQAVFSPALADAMRSGTGPVRLRPASDADTWIFQRLTHEIPSYRGVPIGDRVSIVGVQAPADYVIQADGRLTPLR